MKLISLPEHKHDSLVLGIYNFAGRTNRRGLVQGVPFPIVISNGRFCSPDNNTESSHRSRQKLIKSLILPILRLPYKEAKINEKNILHKYSIK